MTLGTQRARPRARGWLICGIAVAAALTLLVTAGGAPVAAQAASDPTDHPALQPIDAQNWVDQGNLTWADYTQVRPDEWHDDSTPGSEDQFRGAVVLADFTDQPFLISQEAGTHPFGNPQPGWEPVTDVRGWMHDYLTDPNEYNGGQTIHGYWMENSHGRLGVSIDTFGPYTLPGKLHEYGMPDGGFNQPIDEYCPQGDKCGGEVDPERNNFNDRNLRHVANSAWRDAIGCPPGTSQGQVNNCGYDFVFYVSAGHDESSTWQEFGEMLFEDREDVPAAFGPPGAEDGVVLNRLGEPMTNWAATRYVEWTSWRAAANHWPNASVNPPRSSTQAESSGQSVYAHEFSHILGLPDNYNNPFADNIRNFTGYWEMMSRGTFNGPGGTHNRWQVPNQGGSGLGPHHMLHFKNQLGVLTDDEQITVQRNDLADQGVAVVRVKARSDVPEDDLVGLTVAFGEGGDLAGSCANQGLDPFYCPGTGYLNYRFEVVDRVGNDSFAPGHGVLMSKSRNSGSPRVWIIDPNPEDINMIDFYRPDGTPVAVVRGDPRQLNDATFHAGKNSGSEYEYIDSFNRLHFYILDTHRDEDGVLYYDLGVRRFDGAGDFDRNVKLGRTYKTPQVPDRLATCTYSLTNTGEAGEGIFDSDVYRLSLRTRHKNWEATLPNKFAFAEAGETVEIPIPVLYDPDAGGKQHTVVTLIATSETDQSVSKKKLCNVNLDDTRP